MKREVLAPMEWINEIFARFTLVYGIFGLSHSQQI